LAAPCSLVLASPRPGRAGCRGRLRPAADAAPAKVAGPGLPTLDGSDGSNVAQRLITGIQAARCRPGRRTDGSIIVCGGKEASERPALHDQTGAAVSTDDGQIHAPDVSGLRPCKQVPRLWRRPGADVLFRHRRDAPATAGSDADRIAKGEIRAPEAARGAK
jgi:hypothetical protein